MAEVGGEVLSWLRAGAPGASAPHEVLAGICERLTAAGVPVHRAAVYVATLHPNVHGRGFVWTQETGVQMREARHEFIETEEYRQSAVFLVRQTGRSVRRRLADPDCPRDFPVLSEFEASGVTDYLAVPLTFTNGEIHVAAWTTRQPGGFTDDQATRIEALHEPLGRVAEIYALRRTATNLLDTYVGRGGGARILAGHILRGYTEAIHAVVALSDLRGFTVLADELPGTELIELLNRHFDCLVPPIEEQGGEVLKFLGDGLLAIFPVARERESEAGACAAALAAVRDARRRTDALNEALVAEGRPPVRFGLALHVGEVLYGNVGGANRLDFTTIGPAVNLVARLERLTSLLGRDVVTSEAFARHRPDELERLGEFELKGFPGLIPVFGEKT